MNFKLLKITLAFAALFAVVDTTRAEILVAATRTSAVTYGGATYLVDFNGGAAGGTEYEFATTEPNTRVVIMFNAEAACAGGPFNWVDVDIVVDPAGPAGEFAVPPTNSDNAFVSGNTTNSDFLYGAGDGWISAASIATTVLSQAGTHTVKVRIKGTYSGIARFDDMSLVVMK